MKELDHKAGESFECSGYADRRTDFDEDAFGCMDVDLQLASLVDWGIKESKEALVLKLGWFKMVSVCLGG